MTKHHRGEKVDKVDPKDRAKIVALYGPPAFLTIGDLRARFHSYSLDTIRGVLQAAGVDMKSQAKRSGVYLSPVRRTQVRRS